MKKKLAIIGAGIAGLTLANFIKKYSDHEFMLAGDVFSKDQIEGYIDLKREEIQEFEHTPHPIEYKLYYSC